jgi:hypothetical protein
VRVTVSFLISEAGNMEKKRFVKSRSALLLALIGSMGMFASGNAAAQRTHLSFSNYAQVYGSIDLTVVSSINPEPTSFRVNGPASYDSFYYSSGNPVPPSRITSASSSWNIPAGDTSSTDLLYNAITNFGQYGYSYDGQARAVGNRLGASIKTTSTDVDWENPNPNGGSLYAYGYSSYNDQWLITNRTGRTRNYGAIVVTAQLHGSFPEPTDGSYNSASAWLSANTSFTDRAGVNYRSDFSISASPGSYYTSGGTGWTSFDWSTPGVVTVQKKLLFQYGTPFNLGMTLQAYSSANGEADFFNTAEITQVELPFDVDFFTGSGDSGLEGVTLGNLRYASTLDDPNTNWDFGNGGGAIVPGVPEPETYAMLLAGLGLLGLTARRRTRRQDRA